MMVALWQARDTQLSAGDFVTFLAAALLLLPALRHLSSLNGPLARMAAGAQSVFAMMIEKASGKVEFRRVSFRYPQQTPVRWSILTLPSRPAK